MKKKKVIIVGGARPNFMKIAPLMSAFKRHKDCFDVQLVHTGQHYDFEMSEIFFQNLKIPKPDIYLNVGSASHAVQVAKIMIAFEKVILKERPNLVIVVGDINSTLACSFVASKLNVKIAHVEAGLRSFDNTMPEEINRKVTDSLSEYLFVTEKSGLRNLKKEGIKIDRIYFVGNIMIDTLLSNMKLINKSDIVRRLNLSRRKYCIITLHRPSNVDSKKSLLEIYDILEAISRQIRIVYPIHPRAKKMLKKHKFLNKFKDLDDLAIIEPLGYIDFIKLVKDAKFVLTDSGGIQEEATVLRVPCLTMRENTERPITIEKGTNCLVGRDKAKILHCARSILKDKTKRTYIPKFWDGKTSKRIVKVLLDK